MFFVLLLFNACDVGVKYKAISVENKYVIDIPTFMSETKELNDVASLQYRSQRKEFYILCIDELKKDVHNSIDLGMLEEEYSKDVDGYANLILSDFGKNFSNYKQSEILDTVINTMPARMVSMQGKFEGIPIFYYITFYEGKKNYFQVMTWTELKSKNKHKEIMEAMFCSFKEL